MRIGEILLNEKTKVSLSIVNFLLLFGFIITAVFTAAAWSTDMENRVENVELKIEDVEQDVKENKVTLTEYGAGQGELKIGQARIETHLIYIINNMEKDE